MEAELKASFPFTKKADPEHPQSSERSKTIQFSTEMAFTHDSFSTENDLFKHYIPTFGAKKLEFFLNKWKPLKNNFNSCYPPKT